MTQNNNISIVINKLDLVVGWEFNSVNQICSICENPLTLPAKDKNFIPNKIINTNKIIIGEICGHAYHDVCLEEYENRCFEDNIIIKKENIEESSLSKLMKQI